MNEYALLIENEFKEIRLFVERPVDIPHKAVQWLEVVREYGEPFEGVVNGEWVIRTVDPSTAPPIVPFTVRPDQIRLLLLQQGMLDTIEQKIKDFGRSAEIKWEYATAIERDDPDLIAAATSMGVTDEQIDQFFIAASQI